MSNFNFLKAKKQYGELFFQFPKVLIYGDDYKKLSSDAKMAYMVFRDRIEYSIKNNWIDNEDNIYFIFTNEELGLLINRSKPTVINVKQELEKVDLLKQVPQGFDKVTKKRKPNRLYLADLEVTAKDVYLLQQQDNLLENSVQKNKEKEQKNAVTLDTTLGKDSLLSKKDSENAVTLDTTLGKDSLLSEKNAVTLDTTLGKDSLLELDRTKRPKDSKDYKESEKADKNDTDLISNAFQPKEENQETERQVIADYIQEQDLEFLYGTKLIQKMATFSFNDFDTFLTYINKLEFSHKSVEKEYGMVLSIYEGTHYSEYTQECLLNTFNNAIRHYRYGKVNNIASYLFVSFKQVFTDLAETVINTKTQSEGKINVPIKF